MEPEKQYSEILEATVTEIQTARISIARKVNEAGYRRVLPQSVGYEAVLRTLQRRISKTATLCRSFALETQYLEQRLIEKIKHFVLELGRGFTFVGNQHRGLRSLVALELKIGAFKPEYVGKMNFYLGLLDRLEKRPEENASIGIILCADKDHLDVEIALQDINKPIGIAEYQLLLPTEELESLVLQEIKDSNKETEGSGGLGR